MIEAPAARRSTGHWTSRSVWDLWFNPFIALIMVFLFLWTVAVVLLILGSQWAAAFWRAVWGGRRA